MGRKNVARGEEKCLQIRFQKSIQELGSENEPQLKSWGLLWEPFGHLRLLMRFRHGGEWELNVGSRGPWGGLEEGSEEEQGLPHAWDQAAELLLAYGASATHLSQFAVDT